MVLVGAPVFTAYICSRKCIQDPRAMTIYVNIDLWTRLSICTYARGSLIRWWLLQETWAVWLVMLSYCLGRQHPKVFNFGHLELLALIRYCLRGRDANSPVVSTNIFLEVIINVPLETSLMPLETSLNTDEWSRYMRRTQIYDRMRPNSHPA